MAEEVKQSTTEEVKEVYSFKIVRLSNGLYDFVWTGPEDKTLDKYHMALEIVDLGKKLDKQITKEDIVATVMNELRRVAEANQPKETK